MKAIQKLNWMVCLGSLASAAAFAQTNTSTNATELGTVNVVGSLNQARSQILTSVGATSYNLSEQQIQNVAQGEDAPFNQVLLRAPGMAQDSLGQVHLRGEHANLQYRIDDVLLPEGITGFGSELDPRFIKDLQIVTGSLPAEYGFRTAGIVDIQTKGSAVTNSGSVEVYGGSYDTIRPSFQYQGTEGKWTFYIDGSYDHNDIGIENPTPSPVPIHDYTDQYRMFLYDAYLIDDSSRLVLMGSANYATFEIPNNPAQTPNYPTNGPGLPAFAPTDLNDNQTEQNYYGVIAYQKSAGDLNYQVSAYGRASGAHYMPENIPADLEYNAGVATDENRFLYSGGAQMDGSYQWGESHTIRAGGEFLDESVQASSDTTVIENFNTGAPSIGTIGQDAWSHAIFAGIYLQDEWKIFAPLTLNYGARFDVYSSSEDDENQISPRVNLVYKPFAPTTLHAGYSRYFTPPPLETVAASDIGAFYNTSAQPGVLEDTPVKAERANYYDAGISQKVLPGLTLGVDGYYKTAQNQLDDGFFGQSLILSSFNYSRGRIRGVEFSANYDHGGFSTYANVAYSVAQGMGAESAQFLWPDPTTLAYVNNHWVYLDHDQRVSGSFGAAYLWTEGRHYATRVYVDAIYGSGLRQDGGEIGDTGVAVPNGASVGPYDSVDVGVEQSFRVSSASVVKARLDVVNVGDTVYPLRTGTGIGVNAAQYGERRGIFGSLSYMF